MYPDADDDVQTPIDIINFEQACCILSTILRNQPHLGPSFVRETFPNESAETHEALAREVNRRLQHDQIYPLKIDYVP